MTYVYENGANCQNTGRWKFIAKYSSRREGPKAHVETLGAVTIGRDDPSKRSPERVPPVVNAYYENSGDTSATPKDTQGVAVATWQFR